MRGFGVLAAFVVMSAACADTGYEPPSLDAALDRVPAELLLAPDEFLIGDLASESCGSGPLRSELIGIDTETLDLLWQRAIPWSTDVPVIIDGLAITVGKALGTYPPSAVAVDIRTGAPAWQRFFQDRYMRMVVEGDRLEARGFDLSVHFDTAGEILSGGPSRGYGELESEGQWAGSLDGDGRLHLMSPDDEQEVVSPVLDIPADFDVVASVEADDRFLLVTVGSDVGPNNHVALIDRATGDELWSMSHVRTGRLAGDAVVYDVRNSLMAGEAPTREVMAVSIESGEEMWHVQAWAESPRNAAPGGFIGATAAGLVFSVQTENQELALEVIGPGESPPDPIQPGPLLGFVPPAVLVDDDVIAAATRDGVMLSNGTATTRWIPTERPVQGIARGGDTLVALVGFPEVGCD